MNSFDLMYYSESINPQTDLFSYKNEWNCLQTYTKDSDGWFIDFAYTHPTNQPLPQEDLEFLLEETGIFRGKPITKTEKDLDGCFMHGFSQFLPERPQLAYYDFQVPFSNFEDDRIWDPFCKAIVNLDVANSREPQDKDLPDDLLLVKLHRKRAKLRSATGTQRVESLRWLHTHRMEVAAYELKTNAGGR